MPLTNRRRGLTRSVKLLILAGLGFGMVPFVSGLLPTHKQRHDRRQAWEIVVDVSDLTPGRIRRGKWGGAPVWVYHRRNRDIEDLVAPNSDLKDPWSNQSRQPDAMRNPWRSIDKKFFVFVPIENGRGCQVQFLDRSEDGRAIGQWGGGFVDPCEGARFDLAGRIYGNGALGTQQNLRVPPYEFVTEYQIRLKAPRGGV